MISKDCSTGPLVRLSLFSLSLLDINGIIDLTDKGIGVRHVVPIIGLTDSMNKLKHRFKKIKTTPLKMLVVTLNIIRC